MARPKKSDAALKNEHMTFRLSADDRLKIEERASLLQLHPSEYVRQCAVQGTVKVVQGKALPLDLVQQLRRIGVNLNQIVKHCHETGATPPPALLPLLEEIKTGLSRAMQEYAPISSQDARE